MSDNRPIYVVIVHVTEMSPDDPIHAYMKPMTKDELLDKFPMAKKRVKRQRKSGK